MTKNEVATTKGNALSTDVMDLLAQNAGLGTDTLTESDKVMAQLKIAQAMSPQLEKDDAKYIPGLSVGDMFNAATGEVYGPVANISVLGIYKTLTVWEGLDAASSTPPIETVAEYVNPRRYAEIMAATVLQDNVRIYQGNKRVNEAYRIAAMVVRPDGSTDPVMIECAKTKFKNAKQLNTLLTSIRHTINGRTIVPPSCSVMIAVEVIKVQNTSNKWYEFKFSRVTENDLLVGGIFNADLLAPLLNEASLLKTSLKDGSVKFDSAVEVQESTANTTVADVAAGQADIFD